VSSMRASRPYFLPSLDTFAYCDLAQRLYPQLPVNVRVANKTTLLPSGGGPDRNSPVLIRKGTGVGWSTYHMHRMTSLYGADAQEFVPERWQDGELERRVGLGYMPFHAGPRLCLGSKHPLRRNNYSSLIDSRGLCAL
jgi:cytochrome P450